MILDEICFHIIKNGKNKVDFNFHVKYALMDFLILNNLNVSSPSIHIAFPVVFKACIALHFCDWNGILKKAEERNF